MLQGTGSSFLDIHDSIEFHLESAKVAFAMELKRSMDDARVNNAQLAEKLAVSRPMITKLLRGDANVTIETMVKASIALDGKLVLKIEREANCEQLFKVTKIAMAKIHPFPARSARKLSDVTGSTNEWAISMNDMQDADEAQSVAA